MKDYTISSTMATKYDFTAQWGVFLMNRNVTILIVFLTVIVVAGYLLWLRGKISSSEPAAPVPTPTVTSAPIPTIEPIVSASPSASPKTTPKVTPKVTSKVTPTKAATSSGKVQ